MDLQILPLCKQTHKHTQINYRSEQLQLQILKETANRQQGSLSNKILTTSCNGKILLKIPGSGSGNGSAPKLNGLLRHPTRQKIS